MIQCTDCEYFQRDGNGRARLTCDPFATIKEPSCLIKWQLIKLDTMVQGYQATLDYYQRLAPMQEKMLRHMEQEMDELDEADQWKRGYDDDDPPEPDWP